MNSKYLILLFMTLVFFIAPVAKASDLGPVPSRLPVPGTVTMIDLGANKCIPCKMMAPILNEVKKEYEGKAAIVFIDVWENPSMAKKFGIRAIPTQIFYDQDGNEIFRHVGFFDKKSIVAKIEEINDRKNQDTVPLTIDDLPVKDMATLILIDDPATSERQEQIMNLLNGVQNDFQEQLVVVYANIQKLPEIGEKFNVQKVPTLLFFDPSGQELHRTEQLPSQDQMTGILKEAGIQPVSDKEGDFPAKGKPTLLCLGDQEVIPKEQIMPILMSLVEQYTGRLAVFYAERQDYPDLVKRYQIQEHPAFIMFNEHGLETFRHYGPMSHQQITSQLNKLGLAQ